MAGRALSEPFSTFSVREMLEAAAVLRGAPVTMAAGDSKYSFNLADGRHWCEVPVRAADWNMPLNEFSCRYLAPACANLASA